MKKRPNEKNKKIAFLIPLMTKEIMKEKQKNGN